MFLSRHVEFRVLPGCRGAAWSVWALKNSFDWYELPQFNFYNEGSQMLLKLLGIWILTDIVCERSLLAHCFSINLSPLDQSKVRAFKQTALRHLSVAESMLWGLHHKDERLVLCSGLHRAVNIYFTACLYASINDVPYCSAWSVQSTVYQLR